MAKGNRGGKRASGGGLTGKTTNTLETERDALQSQATILFKSTMKTNKKYYDEENLESNRKKLKDTRALIDKYNKELERRKGKKTGSSTKDQNIREKIAQTHTTTYDRARKRRKSNFDAWFFGGSGK